MVTQSAWWVIRDERLVNIRVLATLCGSGPLLMGLAMEEHVTPARRERATKPWLSAVDVGRHVNGKTLGSGIIMQDMRRRRPDDGETRQSHRAIPHPAINTPVSMTNSIAQPRNYSTGNHYDLETDGRTTSSMTRMTLAPAQL